MLGASMSAFYPFKTAICVIALSAAMFLPKVALADFYVSPSGSDSNPGTLAAPFQTVDKARLAVRGISGGMASDIRVYLRGGTYVLGGTLSFDPGDSGKNGYNVIYQAYSGERPSLTGGRRLSGWTAVGGGVYRASSSGMRFRQLYVNGKRGTRARTPNAGSYNHVLKWVGPNWPDTAQSDGKPRYIDINASEISSWSNFNKVEMVTSNEWMQANLRLASFTTSGSVAHVTPQYPDITRPYRSFCYLRAPNDQGCSNTPSSHDSYFFENAREFLDQPGEWYLDESAGFVYYMPRVGEDMTSAVVMAPSLNRILGIVGGAGNPVRNLQFYGLTFEHSNWLEASDKGLWHGQGDEVGGVQGVEYGHAIQGAVHIEYADNIRFERDIIQNTGAGGIEITQGSRNINLTGNVVRETAAGGIVVAKGIRAGNADPSKVVRNITIRNNYVTGIGRDYRSGIGIDGQFASPIIIDHNEVTNVAYSGIGLDWRQDDGATTDDVQITNNHVYNVMNMLADGGGIYTFEIHRSRTLITGNYVHGVHRSGFGGAFPHGAIYLDQGTDYVTLTNNVLADADELIHTNWSGNPNASLHNSLGYNPTSDAAIQANAGIQTAYQDIKTGGGSTITTTTTTTSLPDVIVTALSYTNGIFTATVKNQGAATTPSGVQIGVGFFVDSVWKTYGFVSGALAAGASGTVNGVASYTVPTGHTIMAYADDAGRFAESNETNNQMTITVGTATTTTTSTSGFVPPTILSPAAGASIVNSTNKVTVSWTAVAGATGGYHVRMADNQDSAIRDSRNTSGCTYVCIDKYQGTQITMDVRSGHTYHFWIHSVDSAGNYTPNSSRDFSYTYTTTAPTTGPLPPPTIFQVTGSTFTWTAVTGASVYLLRVHQIGTPYDPCTAMTFCAGVTGTSKSVTLKPATAYDAWIHSQNAAGVWGASTRISFTTP